MENRELLTDQELASANVQMQAKTAEIEEILEKPKRERTIYYYSEIEIEVKEEKDVQNQILNTLHLCGEKKE